MDTELDGYQQLRIRIEARRARLTRFLQTNRPRHARLSTAAIISSGAAAAFTAGPAFGGPGFTASTAELLSLSDTSAVWRVLCLLALVVSVISAVSVNLANTQNLSSRVSAAEACNTELEGLQTLIDFGEIPLGDAVRLYHGYISKVAFLPDVATG